MLARNILQCYNSKIVVGLINFLFTNHDFSLSDVSAPTGTLLSTMYTCIQANMLIAIYIGHKINYYCISNLYIGYYQEPLIFYNSIAMS